MPQPALTVFLIIAAIAIVVVLIAVIVIALRAQRRRKLAQTRETRRDDEVKYAFIVYPCKPQAEARRLHIQRFCEAKGLNRIRFYDTQLDKDGRVCALEALEDGADVVIATPGRLIAHLQNSGVDLSHVKYFVLDEADRMLDMGFFDDIMTIVRRLPAERQTLMFSATLPPKIRELARQILRKPVEINIAVSKPNEAIEQGAYVLYETQKLGLIKELFAKPLESKTIIFSSSKLKVKELAFAFKRMHLNAAAMHSDLDQAKREEVMLDFKNGKIDLLVATDIVARGIDIEDIGMVVNYDVPHDPEDYIHRIGRTARASATGRALTFVNEKEQGKFRRIEEFMEREVEKLPLPEKLGKAPAYEPSASGDRRGRGGRKGRGEAKGRGGRAGERPKAAPREAVPDSGAASPAIAGTEGVEGRHTERRRHRGGHHRRRGRKPAEGAPAVQGGGDASDRGGNA